jgi:hypothetical protein
MAERRKCKENGKGGKGQKSALLRLNDKSWKAEFFSRQ